MRLICGILRLDGGVASDATLDRMAAAMTAPGLAPSVTRRREGALGMAVLDFTGRGEGLFEREGWIAAADLRLDRGGGAPDAWLVDAVQRHGPDFPDRIDGDFAVALWQREAATLWLGRDFIGARPLAWTMRPGQWFAFASLPKGLHGAGLASAEIDPVALGVKLRQSFFHGADSGFADIAYLPAGHSLCVGADAATAPRPHRAYRPDPRHVGSWRGSPAQAADTLRTLVTDAVAARMPPEGPVACHLSGGLDSSAITVLAAREARRRGGRVLALSMTTAQAIGPADRDERPMIAAVLAQEPDIDHALEHDGVRMPGQREDPDWPGSVIDGFDDRIMARAAATGADRVLSGVGGDEGATYNGAGLYARLLRQGALRTLAREIPARARHDGVPVARAIVDRLIVPLLPGRARRLIRRRPSAMDDTHGTLRYLHPGLRARVRARSMAPILQSNTAAERVTAFADHHIPSRCTYYAILAARHGIAVSYPLLDRRIVDFMLSLPPSLFVADGVARQPFRTAMRGILPDTVRLARHKVGLFDQRFEDYAARKPALLGALAALRTESSNAATLFDLDAIAAGLDQLPEPGSAPDRAGSRHRRIAPWEPMIAVECLIAASRLAAAETGGEAG